ncbi:MAG: hypothetical protein MHM6MM_007827 [Cercozoa sp. M6MM]
MIFNVHQYAMEKRFSVACLIAVVVAPLALVLPDVAMVTTVAALIGAIGAVLNSVNSFLGGAMGQQFIVLVSSMFSITQLLFLSVKVAARLVLESVGLSTSDAVLVASIVVVTVAGLLYLSAVVVMRRRFLRMPFVRWRLHLPPLNEEVVVADVEEQSDVSTESPPGSPISQEEGSVNVVSETETVQNYGDAWSNRRMRVIFLTMLLTMVCSSALFPATLSSLDSTSDALNDADWFAQLLVGVFVFTDLTGRVAVQKCMPDPPPQPTQPNLNLPPNQHIPTLTLDEKVRVNKLAPLFVFVLLRFFMWWPILVQFYEENEQTVQPIVVTGVLGITHGWLNSLCFALAVDVPFEIAVRGLNSVLVLGAVLGGQWVGSLISIVFARTNSN